MICTRLLRFAMVFGLRLFMTANRKPAKNYSMVANLYVRYQNETPKNVRILLICLGYRGITYSNQKSQDLPS